MRDLDEQLAALTTMTTPELRTQWSRVFNCEPPAFAPDLLSRSIAYHTQEIRYGGLPPAILRQIRKGMAELDTFGATKDPVKPLRSGTRLTRDWHGRTHYVLVTESGFDYQDRSYRSLTAIARKITGAGWSGPRFFGLTSRAQGVAVAQG